MPNFYSRPRGGLITPPGSEMYGYRNVGQGQYGQNTRGKNPVYDQSAYAPPAAPLMYQPSAMHYNNMPTSLPPGLPRPTYGPIAAPASILPPMADRSSEVHQSRHERQERRQQPAKQEKVTGGVAQELDYEMDQMTDYVSEMAQEIVMPRSKVSPAFRKFVSGLLSSTRLPSSTILLGLNYLAKRMSMLNTPTPYKSTDGQVWRMLTISLLLGSKFLDDNTFQNRSWSEVSGIPVAELNTLESEWLIAISWNLHVDPVTDSDFQCWLASWASWKETKNQERSRTLERLAPLAPIDTNVQRQRSQRAQRKEYSPPTYPSYSQSRAENRQSVYQAQSRYESSWSQASSSSDLSPPSAPESGPNTPEWMMLPGSGMPPNGFQGYNNFYNNRRPAQSSTHNPYAPVQQQAPFHAPYSNPYNQQNNIWGHPAGCGCSYCNMATESYFATPSYGQQTVVG